MHLWEGKLGRTAKGDPFSVISARSQKYRWQNTELQKYRWQILLAIKNPGFGLAAIFLRFYVFEYKGGNLSKFRITWKAWLIESPPVKVADMNIWATQRKSWVFMHFTYFHMFLILPVWLNLWTFQKFATKKAVFLNHDRPLLNSVINTYICHIFEQICSFINICSWFSHFCRNFFCLHLCTFCAIFFGLKSGLFNFLIEFGLVWSDQHKYAVIL